VAEPRFKAGDTARNNGDEVYVDSYDPERDVYKVTADDPIHGDVGLSVPREELERETAEWEEEEEESTELDELVGAKVTRAVITGKFREHHELTVEFDNGAVLKVVPFGDEISCHVESPGDEPRGD